MSILLCAASVSAQPEVVPGPTLAPDVRPEAVAPSPAGNEVPEQDGAAKLETLAARFRSLEDFTLHYHHGRPPAPGDWRDRETEVVDGKLKVRRGGMASFSATEEGGRERLYKTDGSSVWRREVCPACPGITKREKRHAPENVDLSAPLFQQAGSVCAACFLEDPYAVLRVNAARFQGEEILEGVKTLRFSFVPEADDGRRRECWFGGEDGIPRKILEYHPSKDTVAVLYLFTNVKINNGFPDSDFQMVGAEEP